MALDLATDDDDDVIDGEFVEITEDDPSDVIDLEDGGAIVMFGDEDEARGSGDWFDNLAEGMEEGELNALATQYQELITRDKDARKKRDDQYEEGLRRTGLGNDAPGGADFQGASRVVHPMLIQACVDFAARTMKELWPANGPAKTAVFGDVTRERAARAQRKSACLNWQLTVQAKEARGELEQLLTQLPLGGAQFLKITWDHGRNRPTFAFVPIDDVYLPFAATNFYTANRKTEVEYLTEVDFLKRVEDGIYRDVDLMPPGMEPEVSRTERANDKIEGRESTAYNEDGLRTIFQIYCIMDLEDEFGLAPYIMSIDKTSNKVLSIYRNWLEDDESKEELDHIVEFPFIPWRGAYPIGLTHMIGGLSGAATGALRALLDSAHIANSQTMIKLKGTTRGGQTVGIQPTEIVELEGGLNIDDIRKLAMPLPYNQPSPVLFQLLGFLVEAGQNTVRTTFDDMANSTENTPVGTQLARIEQGLAVYSAIHGRLHAAFGRVLRVLDRLNGQFLDDDRLEKEAGQELARQKDFSGPLDVVPVSDPNIFTEAQRFAQVQAVAQRATLRPDLYDGRKVEERILETLKIPDPLSLLMPAQTPSEENAVKENVKASLGQPVIAFPDQDHVAHLKTHLAYLMSPALGSNALFAPKFMPVMLGHLAEHIALWYAQKTFEAAEATAKSVDGEEVDFSRMIEEAKTPEEKRALDALIAETSLAVVDEAAEAFADLPPVIQQVQAMIAQFQPNMPMDPTVMAAMEDIKMRRELGQGKLQLDQQKLQVQQQSEQVRTQADQQRAASDAQRQQIQIAGDQQKLAADQQRLQAEARRDELETQRVAAELQADAQDRTIEAVLKREDIAAKERMNDQDNETAIEIAKIGAKARPKTDHNSDPGKNPNSNPNPNKNP